MSTEWWDPPRKEKQFSRLFACERSAVSIDSNPTWKKSACNDNKACGSFCFEPKEKMVLRYLGLGLSLSGPSNLLVWGQRKRFHVPP